MQKLVVIILIFISTNVAEGDEQGGNEPTTRSLTTADKWRCNLICYPIKKQEPKCQTKVSDLLVKQHIVFNF